MTKMCVYLKMSIQVRRQRYSEWDKLAMVDPSQAEIQLNRPMHQLMSQTHCTATNLFATHRMLNSTQTNRRIDTARSSMGPKTNQSVGWWVMLIARTAPMFPHSFDDTVHPIERKQQWKWPQIWPTNRTIYTISWCVSKLIRSWLMLVVHQILYNLCCSRPNRMHIYWFPNATIHQRSVSTWLANVIYRFVQIAHPRRSKWCKTLRWNVIKPH